MKRIIFEPLLGPDGKQVVRPPQEGEWYDDGGTITSAILEDTLTPFNPIFTRREEEMESPCDNPTMTDSVEPEPICTQWHGPHLAQADAIIAQLDEEARKAREEEEKK